MKSLSVIVPVYNAEKQLKRCLDSILNQQDTTLDYEIVIINDGSKDSSKDIIQQFIQKYPNNIKYYEKENGGISSARNLGIEKASGKYLMFVDADDYIDTKLFKTIQEYMLQGIQIIKFKLQRVNEQGQILEIVSGPNFDTMPGPNGFNLLYAEDVLLDSPCVYAFQRKLFIDNNLKFNIQTRYHEDFGLIPLILLKAESMISCNYYGYYYVQSDNSITRNNDYEKTKIKANNALVHYDTMLEKLETFPLDKKTKENVKIYYTNAILMKINELKEKDKESYIQEIQKRKMTKNIKARNIKQLAKKILLAIDIKLYLKIR